jgi:multidrug efflux pump subunit AcrA (membrane-fusion protein)
MRETIRRATEQPGQIEAFEGTISRTAWTLDAKNRTLRTEIDVRNPKGTLRPGLYAYATIIVEEHAGVLSLPTSALVRQDFQT